MLDVGCGVGTTAIRLAQEFGAQVVAADIAPLMRERALANVSAAQLGAQVSVEDANILALPYPDDTFEVVVAEAVTMFVNWKRAASELAWVCRPGGRVLATEFFWLRPPTPEARELFLGEICPGLRFDSVEEWVEIYGGTGLVDVRTECGPFEMMSARGFLADEGRHTADEDRAGHVPTRIPSQDDAADAADGTSGALPRLCAGDGYQAGRAEAQ